MEDIVEGSGVGLLCPLLVELQTAIRLHEEMNCNLLLDCGFSARDTKTRGECGEEIL